ncbi:MAG: VanZ family protein [Pseudomonadota bacterium]
MDRQSLLRPLRWWKLWFALGCLLILAVIWGSLSSPPSWAVGSDKAWHSAAYAVIALWWLQLVRGWRAWLLVVAGTVLLGVAIEVAQSFHPLRHFDYYDMLFNGLGALAASAIAGLGGNHLVWHFERLVLGAGD